MAVTKCVIRHCYNVSMLPMHYLCQPHQTNYEHSQQARRVIALSATALADFVRTTEDEFTNAKTPANGIVVPGSDSK